jgi:hypothetical protein
VVVEYDALLWRAGRTDDPYVDAAGRKEPAAGPNTFPVFHRGKLVAVVPRGGVKRRCLRALRTAENPCSNIDDTVDSRAMSLLHAPRCFISATHPQFSRGPATNSTFSDVSGDPTPSTSTDNPYLSTSLYRQHRERWEINCVDRNKEFKVAYEEFMAYPNSPRWFFVFHREILWLKVCGTLKEGRRSNSNLDQKNCSTDGSLRRILPVLCILSPIFIGSFNFNTCI